MKPTWLLIPATENLIYTPLEHKRRCRGQNESRHRLPHTDRERSVERLAGCSNNHKQEAEDG